ncbi:hypothetical protein COD79_27815, partial [Bacillus cereus]
MKNKINLQMQNISFVIIMALAVWLKTYLITRFSFDLKIESSTQELILFISPLAASLAFVGLALFATGEKGNYIALCINFLLTIVLVGNVMFYDFYSDFVTLPVLGQTSNFGQLGGSIIEILNYKIILAFVDIVFFFILLKKKSLVFKTERVTHSTRLLYFLLTIGVFFANLHLAEKERPELLTRSFDRVMLVKNLGLYTHQVYDLTLQVKAGSQKALADSSKLQET